MTKKINVAVDGHSSCGKSTIARDLAREVSYTYIDSGAMYRAVTLYTIRHNLYKGDQLDLDLLRRELNHIHITFRHNPATGRSDTYLNGENVEQEIRLMEVSNRVSPVAAVGFVREAMVAQQQAMGKDKGVIMDGRDIGTIVFPDAELKLFITASPEVRAQRRLRELTAKGEQVTLSEVMANLMQRDHIDSTRKDGPLRQADDAIVIDNTNLSIEEQNRQVLHLFHEALNNESAISNQ